MCESVTSSSILTVGAVPPCLLDEQTNQNRLPLVADCLLCRAHLLCYEICRPNLALFDPAHTSARI